MLSTLIARQREADRNPFWPELRWMTPKRMTNEQKEDTAAAADEKPRTGMLKMTTTRMMVAAKVMLMRNGRKIAADDKGSS